MVATSGLLGNLVAGIRYMYTQPLMRSLRVEATARASFAAHSGSSDVEALVRGIEQVKRIFSA